MNTYGADVNITSLYKKYTSFLRSTNLYLVAKIINENTYGIILNGLLKVSTYQSF